jgi:hypothetical protein
MLGTLQQSSTLYVGINAGEFADIVGLGDFDVGRL